MKSDLTVFAQMVGHVYHLCDMISQDIESSTVNIPQEVQRPERNDSKDLYFAEFGGRSPKDVICSRLVSNMHC